MLFLEKPRQLVVSVNRYRFEDLLYLAGFIMRNDGLWGRWGTVTQLSGETARTKSTFTTLTRHLGSRIFTEIIFHAMAGKRVLHVTHWPSERAVLFPTENTTVYRLPPKQKAFLALCFTTGYWQRNLTKFTRT